MSVTLRPWERRNEYYQTIQLGKDVRSQTEIISRQTQNLIAAQASSANDIIASNEAITEAIDSLRYNVDAVTSGIAGLKAAFEWGISEVVWQIEQNREVLKDILVVLQSPLETQAIERKNRAIDAYGNGWIDDAEEEYLISESLNKYDFSIHITLGIIYLNHKHDKAKAMEYFSKAVKYAKPRSNYYTSYALLYRALIYSDDSNYLEAVKCAQEATELSPEMLEAYYQCAQYQAKLLHTEPSLANLTTSIINDFNYCFKVDKDEMFDGIRVQVNDLLTRLRDEAIAKCKIRTTLLEHYSMLFDNMSNKLCNILDIPMVTAEIKKDLDYVKHKIYLNSYQDAILADRMLDNIYKTIIKCVEMIMGNVLNCRNTLHSEYVSLKTFCAEYKGPEYVIEERKNEMQKKSSRKEVVDHYYKQFTGALSNMKSKYDSYGINGLDTIVPFVTQTSALKKKSTFSLSNLMTVIITLLIIVLLASYFSNYNFRFHDTTFNMRDIIGKIFKGQ